MTREEKINNLTDKIKSNNERITWCKNHEELKLLEEFEFEDSYLQRELKLLQIKPRTIETLEVGDVVFLNDISETKRFENRINIFPINHEFQKEEIEIYIKHCNWEFVKTIPHEYLEIWSELHE